MKMAVTILIASVALACSNGKLLEPGASLKETLLTKYEHGVFDYSNSTCKFTPPSSQTVIFVCNQIIIGLEQGRTLQEYSGLLSTIEGETIGGISGRDRPWVLVRIPSRQERSSLITSLKDEKVRYANLNISGPISTN